MVEPVHDDCGQQTMKTRMVMMTTMMMRIQTPRMKVVLVFMMLIMMISLMIRTRTDKLEILIRGEPRSSHTSNPIGQVRSYKENSKVLMGSRRA
jgi:hypothetical protein